MKRPDWQQLRRVGEKLAILSLQSTPLNRVTRHPHFITAVAKPAPERVTISIYRLDPKDAPTPINVDHYSVYERLPPYLDKDEMIKAASTAADLNFQNYIENTVFILKDESGDDHWLPELPSDVGILIARTSP